MKKLSGLYDFEKLVGSIVLKTTNCLCRIEEGKALLLAMPHYLIQFEALLPLKDKVIAVAEEHLSFDAPMVVDEIWVKEIHAPTLSLWRETAEKQHLRLWWQEAGSAFDSL